MKKVRVAVAACMCLLGPVGGAAGQGLYNDGAAAARSGQTEVPGGVLQWRFIETPRFATPPRYRRYGQYGSYRRGYEPRRFARPPFAAPFGSYRSRALPAAPGAALSYRFDETRGVWIAERPVGL